MSEKEAGMARPAQLWSAELNHNVSQPPLALEDSLLVAAQDSGHTSQHSRLIALNLLTGEQRWQHEFEYALISGLEASRLLPGRRPGAIVATTSSDLMRGEGRVVAFDKDGQIAWQWRSDEQSYSAPAIAGRQAYVTAGAGALIAVRPDDGGDYDEQRIKLDAKASLSAPLIHQGVAYVPCRGPELLAVGLDGDVRWHFKLQGTGREWLDKTPVIVGDQVLVASSMGSLLSLDLAAGTLVWREAVGDGRPLSRPAVSGDRLYVGTRHGVTALESRSGQIVWSFSTSRPVSAAPLVYYDTLFVTCEDHNLYALELDSGAESWRHELKRRIEVSAVTVKAALIAADRGGNIVALEAPAPPVASEGEKDPAVVLAFRRSKAEEYEDQNMPLEAAKEWQQLGDLERAAERYEQAQAWLNAARLWLQMDRYGKRAEALRKHARQVSTGDADDEAKAIAWEQAARAYAETNQKKIRMECEREVARYRQQAILTLAIEPVELSVDSWSKLNYTVSNEGFGIARHVDVSLKDDLFEGQKARTQTIITLQPGQSYSHWIDVSPRSQGTSVPMDLALEYTDKSGKLHVLNRTHYMSVAAPTGSLSAASWAQSEASGDTDGLFSRLPSPDGRNLPELREKIVQHFSRDELGDVIFELELLEDNFDEKLSVMAKELILLMSRHDRLNDLIAKLKEVRPSVDW